MARQKETHTVILENRKEVTIFCETSKRLGYAMEEASKQKTRVLRII